MGRHSAPSEQPAAAGLDEPARPGRLEPVTNPILLDGIVSRPRTDRVRLVRPATPQAQAPAAVAVPAPTPPQSSPFDTDDEWEEEQEQIGLPEPIRASVAAAATAPVPLLDRPMHGPDGEETPAGPVRPAPSLQTDPGPMPAGVRDRPLQMSWPWFGVALIAVAALSIIAVLPL